MGRENSRPEGESSELGHLLLEVRTRTGKNSHDPQVDRHMRIVRPGALWDDDRRACLGRWWVVSVESATPRIDLKLYQREPPAGWKLPRGMDPEQE